MTNKFDFIVIGAGMVGLSAALALSRQGLRGQVFDQSQGPQGAPDNLISNAERSARVSAINAGSVRFLSRIGLPQSFFEGAGSALRGMKIWDADGSAEASLPASGYIIENHRLIQGLDEAVRSAATSEIDPIQWQTGITDIIQSEGEVSVRLTSGAEISAPLLIGADGANSRTRELLGIRTIDWPYDQTALVATVQLHKPHEGIARQAFTREGPMALLPLPEVDQCVLVWSSTCADQRLADGDARFASLINQACEHEVGPVRGVGPRQSFPLFQRHAKHYVKDSTVLIGDAAHSIHPLAGQGVNLGFADVAALSELIDQLHYATDLTLSSILADYQQRRRLINWRMTAVTDLTKRLFDPPGPLLRWLRNAALRRIDSQTALKQVLSLAAAGEL